MSILNLKIGTGTRKLTVRDIYQETITKVGQEDKKMEKIILVVEDTFTGNQFNISDAWVETPEGVQIKGLWLALQNDGKEISKNSTLAKVIEYYRTDTLGDLVNTTVDAYPDRNNFLVLVACSLPENV